MLERHVLEKSGAKGTTKPTGPEKTGRANVSQQRFTLSPQKAPYLIDLSAPAATTDRSKAKTKGLLRFLAAWRGLHGTSLQFQRECSPWKSSELMGCKNGPGSTGTRYHRECKSSSSHSQPGYVHGRINYTKHLLAQGFGLEYMYGWHICNMVLNSLRSSTGYTYFRPVLSGPPAASPCLQTKNGPATGGQ